MDFGLAKILHLLQLQLLEILILRKIAILIQIILPIFKLSKSNIALVN